jgi:Protein of unknown function (DUF2938)
MTPFDADLPRALAIGIGATAVMDLWLILLKALGLPTLNFALLGRWVGHIARGSWAHDAIAKAAPVRGETALGWAAHYFTGITFALLLAALTGPLWLRAPSLLPALSFGIGTVLLPLLVMQPAMGAGVASSRTATPSLNVIKSLANHTVFGLGLYVVALAIANSTGA